MMKKIFYSLAFSLFALSICQAQLQPDLLGTWHDDDLIVTSWLDSRYNEIWGFAVNGSEFAVIGSTEGMHIIDVTDPTNPEEVSRIDGTAIGTNLVHRDFKTYNDHLFCVADEGSTSTLQIIDISDLPNSATQVYSSNEFVVTAHNIYIEEAQARLYIIGDGPGVRVLDISDPVNPEFIGDGGSTNFIPNVHDAYVRDNIAYLNCGGQGFWVVDYNDPENANVLGIMTDYPEAGYNHSGWLSEDGNYYFLCDETHGSSVKVVDVSDFSDMKVLELFSPGVWDGEIAHNAILRDGYLYVSYYYDGLQVWDVTNPLEPQHIAQYDTYNGPNEIFYAGNWGVYPLLPSGNILLSDMQSGLIVLEALPPNPYLTLIASEDEFNTCVGEPISFDLTVGSGFSSNGVMLELDPSGTPAVAEFSQNPAMPGETVTVTITGFSNTNGLEEELIILADDGTDTQTETILIVAGEMPGQVNDVFAPAPGAVVPVTGIHFEWSASVLATSYKLQISTAENDFDNNIVFSASTSNNQFNTINTLQQGTSYFWRVNAINDCGTVEGNVQNFTTEVASAAGELNGQKVNIYPNPASDYIRIHFENNVVEPVLATLSDLTGRTVKQYNISSGEHMGLLDLSDVSMGVYLLQLTNGRQLHTQRIVIN